MKLGSYGTVRQHTTVVYDGEINSHGQRHGIGELTDLQAHSIYNGEFKNNLRDGLGTLTFGTGERYQGSWRDDLMHGSGTVTYPPASKKGDMVLGDRFKGLFRFGLRVRGSIEYAETHMTYYDSWTDDAPGPSGHLAWKSGSHYKGQVGYSVSGKFSIKNYTVIRQGYGEMYWHDNKQKYMGHWRKDERKGYGVLIMPNGGRYWGFWKKGKKHGYGIELLEDGSFYEGSHGNDERRGKGKICLPNGMVIVGDWSGTKVSNATMHQGNFEDVPKPLREIFVNKVVRQQLKLAEKALFVTKDKWEVFMNQNLVFTSNATLDYDCLPAALGNTKKGKILCSHLGLDKLLETVEKFSDIFIWNYDKPGNVKHATYRLHNATDDVLSFLECIASFLTNAFKLSKSNKKRLYEIIIEAVFQRIFDCIYKLYTTEYKTNNNQLYAKFQDLSEVTPATMGVKPKWHLTPNSKSSLRVSSKKPENSLKMTPPAAHRSSSKTLSTSKPERTLPSSKKKSRARQGLVISTTTTTSTDSDYGKDDPNDSSTTSTWTGANISGVEDAPPKIGKKGRVLNLQEYQQQSIPPKISPRAQLTGSSSTEKEHNIADELRGRMGNTEGTDSNTSEPNTENEPGKVFKKGVRNNSQLPMSSSPNSTRALPKPAVLTSPPLSLSNSSTSAPSSPSMSTFSPPSSPPIPLSTSNAGSELERDLEAIDTIVNAPELESLPYHRVIKTLRYMSVLKTPLTKMQCLTAGASAILSCVDEYTSEKKEKILMGAEDKFPVDYLPSLTNLPSQLMFLSDFSHELVGDEEYKYRISELSDAIKYINSLEWQIRDENDILVPLKMILSSVASVARTVHNIDFERNITDIESEADKILLCVSSIFLSLGQRAEDPYSAYKIRPKVSVMVRKYTRFFQKIIEASGTGLLFFEEEATDELADNYIDSNPPNDTPPSADSLTTRRGGTVPVRGTIGNYFVKFKFKLPLYVYTKLAEVAVTREVTPDMLL